MTPAGTSPSAWRRLPHSSRQRGTQGVKNGGENISVQGGPGCWKAGSQREDAPNTCEDSERSPLNADLPEHSPSPTRPGGGHRALGAHGQAGRHTPAEGPGPSVPAQHQARPEAHSAGSCLSGRASRPRGECPDLAAAGCLSANRTPLRHGHTVHPRLFCRRSPCATAQPHGHSANKGTCGTEVPTIRPCKEVLHKGSKRARQGLSCSKGG